MNGGSSRTNVIDCCEDVVFVVSVYVDGKHTNWKAASFAVIDLRLRIEFRVETRPVYSSLNSFISHVTSMYHYYYRAIRFFYV